jgi:hypothetical protein
MCNLLQYPKTSIIGFLCGIILVIGANLLDIEMQDKYNYSAGCTDCVVSLGFPYPMFDHDGLVGIFKVFWLGIFANLFTWLIFSIGLGCVFQKVSRIIKSKSASD